jgi:hypothetical protein
MCYRPPTTILSDNGGDVINKLMDSMLLILFFILLSSNINICEVIYEVFQIRSIQGQLYHSETCGQVERKNRTIKTVVLVFYVILIQFN